MRLIRKKVGLEQKRNFIMQVSGWQTFSAVLFLDIISVKNYNFPAV